MNDSEFMDRALTLAGRGRGRTAPNPLVGAVVVSTEGVVVGSGYHERAGQPHAEVHALAAAGPHARGATLYCTLEPCCHHGRTGPCVEKIMEAGIARVVVATEDPNPRVAGRGLQYLRDRGLPVTVGIQSREAQLLNGPFFTAMTQGRPFVIVKAATSLDGRIAAAPGLPTKLTSAAADRVAHLSRAEVDAIAVGSNTVLVDDPRLTVREVYRSRPLVRAILDRRLKTPPHARIMSTLKHGPVVILTSAESLDTDRAARLSDAGALLRACVRDDIASAMRALRELDVNSVLLEGGATVQAAAWDAGVVDAVHLYIAPVVLGPGGVRVFAGCKFSVMDLSDLETFPCGPDVAIRGYVHRPH